MRSNTKKTRKWDAKKEEIDDQVEKKALEALEGKFLEIVFKTLTNLF